MAIPRYDKIQFSAMEILSDGKERKVREMELPLAKIFKLTEDEISQMYESGNGPVFYDRIQWALSYLSMAGVVTKPKRGVYKINKEGLKLLKKSDNFKDYIKKHIELRDKKNKN